MLINCSIYENETTCYLGNTFQYSLLLSFNMSIINILRLETKQEGPSILHGRNPEELPSRQLDNFQENEDIFAAYTGPDSGLTAVNLQQKHLSISDTDIDYIDMLDQNEQYRSGKFRI